MILNEIFNGGKVFTTLSAMAGRIVTVLWFNTFGVQHVPCLQMSFISIASAKTARIVASKIRRSGTVKKWTVIRLIDGVLLNMSR